MISARKKDSQMTQVTTTILIACLSAAAWPATARAELRFCNHTDVKVDLVIAYAQKDAPGTTTNNEGAVTAEGWFWLQPGECAKISDIDVGDHWTYFSAFGKGKAWGGSEMLCIPGSAFTKNVSFLHEGKQSPRGARSIGPWTCPGERLLGFRRIEDNTKRVTMNLH
jgi:uncharacterized membrane protein